MKGLRSWFMRRMAAVPEPRRIRLEPVDQPPLVLKKGKAPPTDAHRTLIRIMAEEAVRQFLDEQAAEGTSGAPDEHA
jgi:hypothetical protein